MERIVGTAITFLSLFADVTEREMFLLLVGGEASF